ncbi:MAG TPA: TonB family protein [Thermoanaerobaculia bacterium]|nr:TonB family protein [Thermoanaerobaculia bacterium]
MFESSLIDLAAKKRSRSRWLSLPAAILLHLVVAASVGFAQYWNVSGVPEPQLNTIFVEFKAPASGGEEAPAKPQKQRQATPEQKPVVRPPEQPVQPTDVTDKVTETQTQGPVTVEIVDAEDLAEGSGDGTGDADSKGTCVGPFCGGPVDGDPNVPPTVAPAPVVSNTPMEVGGAVLRPEVIHRVDPRYTEPARKSRLQGTVVVQAVIDEQGLVTQVKVVKALPMGLDQSAAEAVRQWRFKPATLHGRPVKVYYSLTINFQLS